MLSYQAVYMVDNDIEEAFLEADRLKSFVECQGIRNYLINVEGENNEYLIELNIYE